MYNRSKLTIIILATVSGGKNYVPSADVDFVLWAKDLLQYANTNHERFGIAPVDADVMQRLQKLEELVLWCKGSAHVKADEVERNDARKVSEKDVRNFVQGALARNIKVSNRDREIMHIPIYDTVRTPVGEPLGQATVTVSYPGRAQLKVHIHHIEDTPYDRKADYGCRVYYKTCAAGDAQPASGHELSESRFTRRKVMEFNFEPTDSGKTAYFCVRYENGKGQAGQWGPLTAAIIP